MKQYTLTIADDLSATLAPLVVVPAPVPAPTPVPPTATLLDLRGMNLAGGGTDWTTWGSAGPLNGTHYLFIDTATVDKLILAGANTFRLLFTWEAIQSAPFGNISAPNGNFAIYGNYIWGLVNHITSHGCKVVLDIHGDRDAGFAAYKDCKVGTLYNGYDVSNMLADLWRQIAAKYKGNTSVMYGVTNEPHDIAATTWYACAQKVINAIRGTGALQTIWMPGIDWTGAGSWMTHNATAWNLTDTIGNLGAQVHLYFDSNSGGGTTGIVSESIGVDRCKAVTTWARSKGLKLLLAEVGLSASNSLAAVAWSNLHGFLLANRDVWSGFTFWAAGPPAWWGGYQFYCGPGSQQLSLIQGSLK